MALFSAGSSLTCLLASFVLNVIITSCPSILPLVASPKALFSALYSSSCTPHLSVLLSFFFPSTTTFTQMILSSFPSTHQTLTQAFLTFKTLFNRSLPGWLLMLQLITSLRLNTYLSYRTHKPTSLLNSSHCAQKLEASSLTNIWPSQTKLHLSPKQWHHDLLTGQGHIPGARGTRGPRAIVAHFVIKWNFNLDVQILTRHNRSLIVKICTVC